MLIAEIRRKLLDLERLEPSDVTIEHLRSLLRETKEDLLTADVFGAIKYLPRAPYLEAVLGEIARFNPTARCFHDHLPELKREVNQLRFAFWPSYATPRGIRGGITEPDVELAGARSLLLFEAKLYSGFGLLQVERQLAVALDEADGRECFVVLVTRRLTAPRFAADGRHLPFSDYIRAKQPCSDVDAEMLDRLRDNSDHVLWIPWHGIARALERSGRLHDSTGTHTSEVDRAWELLSDLQELLSMRGIRPFHGLREMDRLDQTIFDRRPVLASPLLRTGERFTGIRVVISRSLHGFCIHLPGSVRRQPLFASIRGRIAHPLTPWYCPDGRRARSRFRGFAAVACAEVPDAQPPWRLRGAVHDSGRTHFGMIVRRYDLPDHQPKLLLQGSRHDHDH